jgi:hypothetical protein
VGGGGGRGAGLGAGMYRIYKSFISCLHLGPESMARDTAYISYVYSGSLI